MTALLVFMLPIYALSVVVVFKVWNDIDEHMRVALVIAMAISAFALGSMLDHVDRPVYVQLPEGD